MRHFNRWRLILASFLLVYTIILLIELDYAAIRWDETPHLYGGLLLSRGQLQDYIQAESFYPPLFDAVTGLYFNILGPSVFSARLVAVTFGVLSVWAVFEFAYRFYGPRTALAASVLLASMPGFHSRELGIFELEGFTGLHRIDELVRETTGDHRRQK